MSQAQIKVFFYLLFSSLTLSYQLEAKATTYFSYLQGNVKDSNFGGGDYGELKYDNNDGKFKEIEFSWGIKDKVGLVTGVRFDTNNKVQDYLLGISLPDSSQFRYRQYSIKDRLTYTNSPYDSPPGAKYVLGNVDAQAVELTYLKPFHGADFLSFTYGKSTLPQIITINSTNGLFGEQQDLIVDLEPVVQYLDVGFSHNGLKHDLTNGTGTGWDIYLQSDVAFGISYYTVGNRIFDWGTGQQSSEWKIAGEKGYNVNFLYHLAPEVAYVLSVGGVRSAFKIGVYVDAEYSSFTDLLKLNSTSKNGVSNDTKNYFWSNWGRTLFGFYAGVGLAF
jgi:hypothetical protein